MKICIFDPFCGVSGNMILGALIDAGVDIPSLTDMLYSLPLDGWKMETEKVTRNALAGTYVKIITQETTAHRNFSDIKEIIDNSTLPDIVKAKSNTAFYRLAEAEAAVHGTSIEKVHFHEVGAIDSIIDIVGCFCGFHLLGIDKFYSSPPTTGKGTVECSHGTIPIPVPATLRLLEGIPTVPSGIEAELTTPTGALILASVVENWQEVPPPVKITTVGMGAGKDGLPRANLLRISIGETESISSPWENDTVLEAVSLIDDMDPRSWAVVSNKLMDAGALDCYSIPSIGKKGRPALEIKILMKQNNKNRILNLFFRHTPSIGIRINQVSRCILRRSFVTVNTEYGAVSVKVAYLGDEVVNIEPEFDECDRIADELSISVTDVITDARTRAKEFIRRSKK